MNKLANISHLFAEIRKLSTDLCSEGTNAISKEHQEQLNAYLSTGPVVVTIFNHLTFKFAYVSPNIEEVLGMTSSSLRELNYQEFLHRWAHPEDLSLIAHKLFPDVVTFITSQSPNDILKSTIHYNYRIKNGAGGWSKIEQQTSPLKTDEEGKLLLEQSFITQTGDAGFDDLYPLKLVIAIKKQNGLYEPCFTKTYLQKHSRNDVLTPRETEVLKMLAKGKTSQAISSALNLSETTVITHRRNMLRKLALKNTSELMAWGFQVGVL